MDKQLEMTQYIASEMKQYIIASEIIYVMMQYLASEIITDILLTKSDIYIISDRLTVINSRIFF